MEKCKYDKWLGRNHTKRNEEENRIDAAQNPRRAKLAPIIGTGADHRNRRLIHRSRGAFVFVLVDGGDDGLLDVAVFDADIRAPGLTRRLEGFSEHLADGLAPGHRDQDVRLAISELASATVEAGMTLTAPGREADPVARAAARTGEGGGGGGG